MFDDVFSQISRAILKEEVEFEDEDWNHVDQETIDVVKGLLQKDSSKRLSTGSILRWTFKQTGKIEQKGWNSSRKKFKASVLQMKLKRTGHVSMSEHMMNSRIKKKGLKHRVGASRDDHSESRNDQMRNAADKRHKAYRGRRGSKTAEQLEYNQIQLPMTHRPSLVENFKSDDDLRKQRAKEKEEKQRQRMADQQFIAEGSDEDDQKEF